MISIGSLSSGGALLLRSITTFLYNVPKQTRRASQLQYVEFIVFVQTTTEEGRYKLAVESLDRNFIIKALFVFLLLGILTVG